MKKNIKKVKKFQKPLMFLVVIFAILFGIAIGKFINANADEINYEYQSNNIGYDSTSNSLNATNVKDAIDELYSKVGQCPNGYNCLTNEEFIATGSKFLRAYTYDESVCVIGNETGCVIATCIEDGTTCPVGTIIDYFVNNTTIVRFHVLHDDGDTITMQAQQSQVIGVAWHVGSDNTSNGPDTILSQLESQTSGWKNVNDIEYKGNDTKFVGVEELSNTPSAMKNNNNYCTSYNSCTSNTYNYPSRTVKARMIMMQEAVDVGCTTDASSCPKFMYNYLNGAKKLGAPQEDNTKGNYGYWTINVKMSNRAWLVSYYGHVTNDNTSNADNGARAVVVVNK